MEKGAGHRRMRKKFLIGLDLDDTVFTKEKKITEKTRQSILQANAKGAEIVFLSGRPYFGITDEIFAFPDMHYLVTSNGALTLDPVKKRPFHGNFLEEDFVFETIEKLKKEGLLFNVFIGGIGYIEERDYERFLKRYEDSYLKSYIIASRRPVRNLAGKIREMEEEGYGTENVWLIIDKKEKREELYREFAEKGVNLLRTKDYDLEMVSPMADKGREILYIAEELGIEREKILAVGDSENDQGMIRAAGCGVAMGNAAAATKELADYVTEDNAHDGAAKAIDRFMLEHV